MPLQDLTPQLRTRLNRMERAVGWFVFLASVLLLFGFGYYIYHTADRKGWFLVKAKYKTYLQSSSGLKVGDSVFMMGFDVGQVTLIHPMPPRDKNNVEVDFEVRDPYFHYIWSEGSFVKLNVGFLNSSQLEVTRGTGDGYALSSIHPVSFLKLDEVRQLVAGVSGHWQLSQNVYDENSNLVFRAYTMLNSSNLDRMEALKFDSIYAYDNTVKRHDIVSVWNAESAHYMAYDPKSDPPVELHAAESPGLADQLQGMVTQVQAALPGILALTNKIAAVLDNAAAATSNLNIVLRSANTAVVTAQPAITNFAFITGQLREPGGPLLWVLGTNGNGQVQGVLTNLNGLLTDTDTNLGALLINLANLTGGLNAQVQANSNLLGGIAKTVGDADDFVQGLKHHWLLRSAFKTKATNQPPTKAK